MNVLFVSECSKNALKESRRILDQFAERRGQRTWQTAITKNGLDTIHKLLRKTARKNTAVACHWIRGKNRTELLWIVGNRKTFGPSGIVATNKSSNTQKNITLESAWGTREDFRLLIGLAALFHDVGKANDAFQDKLKAGKPVRDAVRHEWVSLRIFEAFVGKSTDEQWLIRLTNLGPKSDWKWFKSIVRDGLDQKTKSPFRELSPLSQMIGWLILTHHRLPKRTEKKSIRTKLSKLENLPDGILAHWCGSIFDLGDEPDDELAKAIKKCWNYRAGLPMESKAWQVRVAKFARAMLTRPSISQVNYTQRPYATHLCRLVLMLADHYYSSLTSLDDRFEGDSEPKLFANTDRKTKQLNQSLDEHLIGVEQTSGRMIHALTNLHNNLPRIANHKGFKRRTKTPRFLWQNMAYDACVGLREISAEQGFFGINMASTGCGKTLANARMMYGLSQPEKGARFTIALGLRTLTIQTGNSLRQLMALAPEDLAVLVGGGYIRELLEHQLDSQNTKELSEHERSGSESSESLIQDNTYIHYEGNITEGPFTKWMAKTHGANALLNAPVAVCTIDHLMPACEGIRGGNQIIPSLRLMTSDLVLDEPDDFSVEDLPALTRLVYLSGLLGGRILLSSATLAPAMVEGLFNAYRDGREEYSLHWNKGISEQGICVLWADEFKVDSQFCGKATAKKFFDCHKAWCEKRVRRLSEIAEVRQKVSIVDFKEVSESNSDSIHGQAARLIQSQAQELHSQHHEVCGATAKKISFGLVRFANIDPLIDVVSEVARAAGSEDFHIHYVCYHSRHPMLIRSKIESHLDVILNRSNSANVCHHPLVQGCLEKSDARNHMFIVFATPVAEVGRDHDFDWAIVEPSSMRSIIQLAGRVRRHRAGGIQSSNIAILERNLASFKAAPDKPVFTRPGFEKETLEMNFILKSRSLRDVLKNKDIFPLTASARILTAAELSPTESLVDLEHARIEEVMTRRGKNPRLASHWWNSKAYMSAELQRVDPFRFSPIKTSTYGFVFDEDQETFTFSLLERSGDWTPSQYQVSYSDQQHGARISPMFLMPLQGVFNELADELSMSVSQCSSRFGTVLLPTNVEQWIYHSVFGFRRNN